jgi:hypothetical protein
MVATVLIREKNGAGETATDKTSSTIRFKNADNATVDTVNPMVVPGAGTDFSYIKYIRVKLDSAPSDKISNVVAYTDGAKAWSAGVSLSWKTTSSYTTPAEETSIASYTSAFSYTSGSPLTLGAGPYSATGDVGDYLMMVLTVDTTAQPGVIPSETMTVAYDEI